MLTRPLATPTCNNTSQPGEQAVEEEEEEEEEGRGEEEEEPAILPPLLPFKQRHKTPMSAPGPIPVRGAPVPDRGAVATPRDKQQQQHQQLLEEKVRLLQLLLLVVARGRCLQVPW